MNEQLSIKWLKKSDSAFLAQICISLVLVLSLSSCSAFKTKDYAIKDSLYMWSDVFDASAETHKPVTVYQSISSMKESILKSDVQLIFEAMVNNELAVTELASEEGVNDSDTAYFQDDSPILLENNVPVADTILAAHNVQEESRPAFQSDIAVDLVNRITVSNPTAAGIPVSSVLPAIKDEIADIELPNEILLLAAPAKYHSGVNEYGMWQLVKSTNSPYHEVCSLSSATMQVEVENYSTQVWFNVVGSDLLVNSTTNIDIRKPQVGIQFDNGVLQTFNKNHFQTSAVWSGDLESVLERSKQISIRLGGNELGRRTQELAIGIKDLKKAYAEYRKCNRDTQIGSL